MPSIRARFVNWYVERTLKPLLASDIAPPDLRRVIESRGLPLHPKTVAREPVAAPVKGEWQRPPEADADSVIYYLHGGGYVFGSPETHKSLTLSLALEARRNVFALDYRLAPENPCPAAIEDALAGYDWLIAQGYAPRKIAVGGDSAGGGLTLALLQALRARGAETPGAAFLYSPWTDLTLAGASIVSNASEDAMFTPGAIQRGAPMYAGDLPLDDPRVSPLFGSFAGLPPLLVFVSKHEMLYDDSVRLVETARAAGVNVTFHAEPGLVHVWPLFNPLMPEAARDIRKTADFIGASG